MAEISLPYGRSHLPLNLPDEWPIELITPNRIPALPNPSRAVDRALDSPVGGRCLGEFADIRSVAIAINDETRPIPLNTLLPPLLERLEAQGLDPEAITLMVATGSHAPMQPDEFPRVVPRDILARFAVISHDAADRDNLRYLGLTRRATPVWINKHFVEADLRIVVGNIEPHQFMGFSGGAKSAAIGLAGMETINHNHAMMSNSRARLGSFDDNPARQDVEEIGTLSRVDFALNVVLNEAKEIVNIFAGEPQAVMRAGIRLVLKLYQVPVSAPFDLMIVSPGGHPKDINLYQAQKALAHAALVAKEGATIILVAACPQGTGSESYEQWMEGMTSYAAVIDRFTREGFRIGPHKAYQIARDAARVWVLLISQIPPDLVRRLLLTPVANLEEALSLARNAMSDHGHLRGPSLRVGVMPWANATIPVLQGA